MIQLGTLLCWKQFFGQWKQSLRKETYYMLDDCEVGGLEGAVVSEAADEARADKLSQELDI
jgi:hypothetical protein